MLDKSFQDQDQKKNIHRQWDLDHHDHDSNNDIHHDDYGDDDEAESPAVSDKDSGFAGLQLARDLWIVIIMIVMVTNIVTIGCLVVKDSLGYNDERMMVASI